MSSGNADIACVLFVDYFFVVDLDVYSQQPVCEWQQDTRNFLSRKTFVFGCLIQGLL